MQNLRGQLKEAHQQAGNLKDSLLKLDGTHATTRLDNYITNFIRNVDVSQFGGNELGSGSSGGPVQRLAAGGIVYPKPGGTLAVIGEGRYPEAVVPLTGSGAGGVGGTVNVFLTVEGNVQTENELIDAVHTGLLKKLGRNPSLGLT